MKKQKPGRNGSMLTRFRSEERVAGKDSGKVLKRKEPSDRSLNKSQSTKTYTSYDWEGGGELACFFFFLLIDIFYISMVRDVGYHFFFSKTKIVAHHSKKSEAKRHSLSSNSLLLNQPNKTSG